MKKLWSVLVCLLLVGTVALTVFASNDDTKVTVTADKTLVKAGDTVNITVSVTGTDPFTSMGYIPMRGSEYFTIGKHTFGDALEAEGYPSIKKFTKNEGLVVGGYTDWVTEEDIAVTINGVILSFPITIKEDAPLEKFNITEAVNFKASSKALVFSVTDAVLEVYCEHTYGPWAEEGTGHKQTCSKCGADNTADHNWDNGNVTTKPNCKTPGVMTYTCLDCGAEKTQDLPITETHEFGPWAAVDGNTHTRICPICLKDESGEHNWDDGNVTTKPNCKTPGVMTYTCLDCGAEKTQDLPITETHEFGPWAAVDGNTHARICPICLKEETGNHSCVNGVCVDCGWKEPYVVIFTDEDGTQLSHHTYYYGDTVTAPAAPTKAADNVYTYAFAGWDKEITAVTGDATYKATYQATYIEYAVTFANEDGTVISTVNYHYGDAVAIPADPAKAADNTYTYSFAGWDKDVAAATENTTYTATFKATYIEYTVTFANEDGTVIFTANYHYGDTVTAPADPTKDPDAVSTYVFSGWDQEVSAVTGNATYTATFEQIMKVPDLDGNKELTDADAVYLLRHTLFPEDYPSNSNMDINCDGQVTDADAVYLLRHTLFPDTFPLYPKTEDQ